MLAFTIITGIASILGLGFSVAAWLEARKAVSAAQEARKAVRRASASEVFKDLNRDASELLAFVQECNYGAAGVRARDLFAHIRAAKGRWERFLTQDSRDNLDEAHAKVKEISKSLASPKAYMASRRLMEYAHFVVGILSDESSKMIARIEAEEE
jgi:hypothetical protein